MRLQVSEYAAARLDDIWDYYAVEASERVANRITKKIVDDIDCWSTRVADSTSHCWIIWA